MGRERSEEGASQQLLSSQMLHLHLPLRLPLHPPFHQEKKKTLKLRQTSKMPFPDPLLDSYNCSVLLRNTMCTEHVLKSESQELKFPSYTSVSLYEENQPRKFLMNTLIGHCGPWRGLLSCAKLSAKPCQCIFYTKVPRVGY